MSKIADPLRHYVSSLFTNDMLLFEDFMGIADGIDSEHEKQMVEALRHERSLAHKIKHGNGEYGHTTCSACGVTVHRRDKWCWSCGARLSGEVEVRK